MVRFALGVVLLSIGFATFAQDKTRTSASVPPPLPTTATSIVAPVSTSSSVASNPFAPRPTLPVASQSIPVLPPPPAPVTEEAVRQQVENAYRSGGQRVGRVNGQTFFKLDKHYLFVPTNLEDAQPVVAKPTSPRYLQQSQSQPTAASPAPTPAAPQNSAVPAAH